MTSSAPVRSHGRLRTWLQLFRAPNLFTVPGDPVAGYLISNSGFIDFSLVFVALSSLCFYSAGLLLNDLVDLAEDREERPSRPLPSQQASPETVRRVLWGLNFAGLLLLIATGSSAALISGVATILAVWAYNCITKQVPFLGALTMGLCRALSLLTGALAGPSPSAVAIASIFAITTGLFIAAVTHLARFETRNVLALTPRFMPLLALLPGSWMGIQNSLYSPDKLPAIALFIVTLLGALWLLSRLLKKPSPLPPLIGAHIRLLLPLQAAACWFGASQDIGPVCALLLLTLWPLSSTVSKTFYSS